MYLSRAFVPLAESRKNAFARVVVDVRKALFVTSSFNSDCDAMPVEALRRPPAASVDVTRRVGHPSVVSRACRVRVNASTATVRVSRCTVTVLTTGLSSPRSESRSASAMAYAGTGSRFFTRILAAFGGAGSEESPRGTCSHGTHTHGHARDGASGWHEWHRGAHGVVCRACGPAPPPAEAPP
ncbi:unnamed protein product, partial [Iphiclides podalirius]